MNGEWATLVVSKVNDGGYAVILNFSERGLFDSGDRYYNHQLKGFPKGTLVNVVVRLSPKGRRMIKKLAISKHDGGVS